jgi:hypothetical protein
MASLWKRANGPQRRMLRIVAGAVIDAANAHPNAKPDKRFARSVSKRAVGTLSAQWTEVLAAPGRASSEAKCATLADALRRKAKLRRLCKRGPAKGLIRWPPLAFAVREIGNQVGRARRTGQYEREAALIECLRIINRQARKELLADIP